MQTTAWCGHTGLTDSGCLDLGEELNWEGFAGFGDAKLGGERDVVEIRKSRGLGVVGEVPGRRRQDRYFARRD